GPAARTDARGAGAAVLGGPERGGHRAAAGLLGRHGQEPGLARPRPAARGAGAGPGLAGTDPGGRSGMSVEELKAGFTRLAEPVVAIEDPYGGLLRRARRTRRARLARWASALAAALALAVLTPLLTQAAGGPYPSPSPGVDDLRGAEITDWVR